MLQGCIIHWLQDNFIWTLFSSLLRDDSIDVYDDSCDKSRPDFGRILMFFAGVRIFIQISLFIDAYHHRMGSRCVNW